MEIDRLPHVTILVPCLCVSIRGLPWRYSVIPSTPDFQTEYQIRPNRNPAGLPVFAAYFCRDLGSDFRDNLITLTRLFKQAKQIRIPFMAMFKVNTSYMSTVPHPEGQSRIFIRCPAVPRNQQMSRIFRKWYYYFFRCRLLYMFASQRNKVTNFE